MLKEVAKQMLASRINEVWHAQSGTIVDTMHRAAAVADFLIKEFPELESPLITKVTKESTWIK